ncbi:DUF3168 domain-containing protein [Sphingomonas tabacisoli]|uniref:DUF3168 domain-containing protein n=1 Tax=Sphingomonas tabacisoli TaxID=2249466 RepID=A0ABW4I1N6_9SPHN
MSFEAALQDAVLAALAAEPVISAQANGVFLERPVRASTPYLVVGDMLSADWSAKGLAGREVRLLIRVHDAGENWAPTVALQGAVGAAIEGLPREIGGYRLGAITLLRARTVRDGATGWLGTVEYRIRGMEG